MLDFGLEIVQGRFFDRDHVARLAGAATVKQLSRFGAYVRTRARSSIRYRKRISQPGKPPSSHTHDAFASIRNILFAYDESDRGVVIGPVPLNGRRRPVPKLLEHGGSARGAARTLHYRPRPFMRPAFGIELERAPELFKNCIH
jgi:hypothetical protein